MVLKNYTEVKKSYIRSLGSWAARSIAIIDESLLSEEELVFFTEGYEISSKEKSNDPVRKIVR